MVATFWIFGNFLATFWHSSEQLSSILRAQSGQAYSQTDDESVSEGCHCCNASLELIEINTKLDKLLKVFGEIETIKERVTQLEDENKQIKEEVDATAMEITNLKTTTVFIRSNMEAHSNELKSLKEEVTYLKRRNIRLEASSRR